MSNWFILLCLAFVAFLAVSVVIVDAQSTPFRVAIVGAGMAGSSTAFNLRQEWPSSSPPLDLVVFEQRERVGGRVYSKEIPELGIGRIELGADSYHKLNLLMGEAVKLFNLTAVSEDAKADAGVNVGIWDGKGFRMVQSEYTWIALLQALWRYGLSPLYLHRYAYEDLNNTWQKQYGVTSPVSSVQEFIQKYNLSNFASQSSTSYFVKVRDLDAKFVSEIVAGVTRGIYQRNTGDINALAASVAVVGVFGDLFSVLEGNDKLYTNSRVDQIGPGGNGQGYSLTIVNNGSVRTEAFDAVVIASPLELTNMSFSGGLAANVPRNRTFSPVMVTFVRGVCDPSYFGFSTVNEIPETITTVDNASSNWTIMQTREVHKDGSRVIKFFSPKSLSPQEISRLFTSVQYKYEHFWPGAYYTLPPNPIIPPLVISQRLYYASAFESVMSVMENAALAGRNVARLLVQDTAPAVLRGNVRGADPRKNDL